MHGGRRRFHIPPCHAEPAAREVVLKSAGWRGGGFPAHEKCPAPARRAGHFRVRLSGRYNALYLAAQKAARRAPGDTPGPHFAASDSNTAGPGRPRRVRPFAAVFAALHWGRGCTPPGRQKRACGRTRDEGRGLLQRRKQRLRFLADAVIHGMQFIVSTCKSVWVLPSGI